VLDKEIDRPDGVVKRFLDFTRPMDVRLEATHLAHLLKEVLDVAKPQLQQAQIQVAQLLPIDVPEAYVDRALLKQAVLNLVLNAIEAMPGGGQLRLVLSRRGEMAEIAVGDTGPGIPPENRQKAFQLFFTTRPGGTPTDFRPSIPATPLRLIAHSVPPQPRETSRGSQTVLVQQLSPEDMSEAKQQTQDSLAVAERNLGSTKGRKLTPAQSDLVAKIRSFIEQAKGAVGNGDWARARTLAEKAQVLSEDLVRSLSRRGRRLRRGGSSAHRWNAQRRR